MKKHIAFFLPFLITLFFTTYQATFAQNPSSSNYELDSFEFGAGGSDGQGSSSTSYTLFGTLGEVNTASAASANFRSGNGLIYTLQAHVPGAPTFENEANDYNKLHITIDNGNNPTDAEFAIQVSTDNFSSDIRYVQDDNTLDTVLGSEDWQTYTSWGGAAGEDIIGLDPGTTYQARVAARQGDFTQFHWSPIANASTSNSTLSFDIDIASSDQETAPPYTIDFGSVTIDSVTTASDKVWIDIDTNANNGGYVYIYGENSGLLSSNTAYTISSVTGDLTGVNEGFGIRSDTATQTTGGPLTAQSPYNVAGDNVGTVDTIIREVYSSSASPITAGRASFLLKLKTSPTTPAANDYTDTLTIIASATF